MGNDIDKGGAMAGDQAGGKRWGLRFKDGARMWHRFTDVPDCSPYSCDALSFVSAIDAERYRLRMDENKRTNRSQNDFVVADLDTGEIIPPYDPRLKSPTVDGGPSKPEGSPEPVAHQWKAGDNARVKADVQIDEWRSWWDLGTISNRKQFTLHAGSIIGITSVYGESIAFRMDGRDGVMDIRPDDIEPIVAAQPEPSNPEPAMPAFQPGDPVKIISGYASNMIAHIVSGGPHGWTVELPSGVHAYALTSQLERVPVGSPEPPSMDDEPESTDDSDDDDTDDTDTPSHPMPDSAWTPILAAAFTAIADLSFEGLDLVDDGRLNDAWERYHRIVGAMDMVGAMLEGDES